MTEESVIIVAYAFVVFAPFLITALVFFDYLNTHGTHYVDKTRLTAFAEKEQSFYD